MKQREVRNGEPDTTHNPRVSVSIPVIKLRLKDLLYLRALAGKKAVSPPKGDTLERLRFLDLIKRAKVAPSPEAIKKLASRKEDLILDLDEAREKEDWELMRQLLYQLTSLTVKLEPRETDVLTDFGREILRSGAGTLRTREDHTVGAA